LLESLYMYEVENFRNKLFVGQCVIVISLYSFVSAEKVNELQELLNKKDQEMKAMEDHYKKYLEKAKSVSFSLAFVSCNCSSLYFSFMVFNICSNCLNLFGYCCLAWSSLHLLMVQ